MPAISDVYKRQSVPCGAGGRVGQAAGGDDHRPGGQRLALHHHPHSPAVFQEQMLCPAPEQGNPLPLQGKKQGVDDIGRPCLLYTSRCV